MNATLDPKLKKALMERHLFKFVCPSCGATMDCEYDVLYHDQEKDFMVWLKHPEDNGVMSMSDAPLDMTEQLMGSYHLRLTTSFGGLVEKIHCFDGDLDDRVVELLKTLVYHQLYGTELDHDADFFFVGIHKRFLRKREMSFVSVTSAGEQWYHVPFSPIYDRAAQQFREICKGPSATGEWLLVNQKYLQDVMSNQT